MSAPTSDTLEDVSVQSASQDIIFPPGDLYSDEPPLESSLHLQQMMLLLQCLDWLWKDRTDYFSAGNLTIYYSPHQRKSEDFRGPDFFVVLDVDKHPRKSWVVWEERGKYPNIIIELLSDSTAKTDRTLKKHIYQDIFRTPDYFWFDPNTLELKGFHLLDGTYHELSPNSEGWLWSQQLQLFLGIHQQQLRYFSADGELIPTPEESATQAAAAAKVEQQRAEAERQRAEAERQRAEAERQQKETLAAKLRELGVNPDDMT
jgi:Uma2 family endonuclease